MSKRVVEYLSRPKTLTAAEQQYVGVIPAATPIIQTTAGIYRAMSCFRQGKVAEARRIFANWEAQMKPVPSTGQPYGQSANHDDLICWLAYKEARPLLFPELQPGK